jgi:MFS family permease
VVLAAPGPIERPTTFSALAVRNYRLYFTGQCVSSAGTWMQNVAVGWFVLQLTHSGSVLGLVTAARYLPVLLFGPWGGLVADRLRPRRLLCGTSAVNLVIPAVIGTLVAAHLMSVGLLLVLVFAIGVADVFDNPARQGFINNLVPRDLLANAIALNSIAVNASRIVGPGVAGLLIAAVGVTPCFYVNAASYAAVILSLGLMHGPDLLPSRRESRSPGQIRAGMRYVAGEPALLVPLLMVAVAGTFAWEFQVTLPLLTAGTFHGSSRAYGGALACVGAGAIVGGLFAARRRRVDTRSLAISACVWGVLILAASAAPTLPIADGLLVFVGVGAVTFNSAAKTVLQLAAPEQLRGRVMSLWFLGWQGSTVLGGPLVGACGQAFGGRYALGVGGLATLLTGAGALRLRSTRTAQVAGTEGG